MTETHKQKMFTKMTEAITCLPAVDLLIYFAFAMSMITIDHIITDKYRPPKKISNKIDRASYIKYKRTQDEKFDEEPYVHDFVEYWIRHLRYPNGQIRSDIVPFITAPIPLIRYWCKHILEIKRPRTKKKIDMLDRLPYQSAVQMQGDFESHFRHWVKPRYVLFLCYLYISSILFIHYLCRMMPPACKSTKHPSPPYDLQSFAYTHRRDMECNPDNLLLCWRCGKIDRPSTHIGIMGLESRNAVLNQYNWVCAIMYTLFIHYLYIIYTLFIHYLCIIYTIYRD